MDFPGGLLQRRSSSLGWSTELPSQLAHEVCFSVLKKQLSQTALTAESLLNFTHTLSDPQDTFQKSCKTAALQPNIKTSL